MSTIIQRPKRVFLSHPISGDVKGNVKKVMCIYEELTRGSQNILVVAPYLILLKFLDDNIKADREIGLDICLEYLRSGFIDEIWLYGDRISDGMKKEIILAWKLKIPVVAKTPETQLALMAFEEEQKKVFAS